MRNVSGFHLLVYAKNGCRNRVRFTICTKKYGEPAIVASTKASQLSGNATTYLNALTRP